MNMIKNLHSLSLLYVCHISLLGTHLDMGILTYGKLDVLVSIFPNITHLAISATATLKSLGGPKPFSGGANTGTGGGGFGPSRIYVKRGPAFSFKAVQRLFCGRGIGSGLPRVIISGAFLFKIINLFSSTDESSNLSSQPSLIENEPKTSKTYVPPLMLANVMSLVPKIDELAYVIDNRCPDLVFITETWLKPNIPDAVINIDNYILLRLDRTEKEHGGVCIYVKENYIADYLEMPNENGFEVLWAVINPRRIPRGFSRLIIAVLYHPPSANNKLMLEYLQSSLESIEVKYPSCGLIIAGDFNKLPTQHICRQFQLKQIVNSPN